MNLIKKSITMLILSCTQVTAVEYQVKPDDSTTRIMVWHELKGGIGLKNDAGQPDLEEGEFVMAESANSIQLSAPIPEGFIDFNIDIAKIQSQKGSW